MAAKFSQKLEIHHLRTRFLPATANTSGCATPQSLPSTSHSFSTTCSQDNKRLSGNWLSIQPWARFRGIAEKWSFVQAARLPEGPCSSTKEFLVLVVKKGETLTSISRWYGVSLHAITAVNHITDVDLVLEGQQLNIPIDASETQTDPIKQNLSYENDPQERCQSTLHMSEVHENCKIFTKLSAQHIQIAKTTGYFLLLVPFIAFCIRCIAGSLRHRVAEGLKHQAVIESETTHHGSRSMRWKSVLSDLREPDTVEAESRQNSVSSAEDQTQVPLPDMSRAYQKLEPAYLKFLSECGMSTWGYWRGGSPD